MHLTTLQLLSEECYLYMWQSRVEIVGYSSCILTALLCLKCHIAELPLRAGLICALNIYEAHVSPAEVQRYNASNTAMRSKYTTE